MEVKAWPKTESRQPCNIRALLRVGIATVTRGGASWESANPLAIPHFPRGIAMRPQLVQRFEVAIRIHAHPELVMRIDGQLSVFGEPLKRLVLEQEIGIVSQVFEDLSLKDEEPSTHEACGDGGLLVELDDFVP